MSTEHQHILLITTDQQRFDTIAAGGNPVIHTPHLDWLCHRGIRYSRCYADAPICGPSRATIMTGRHAYHQQENYNCWQTAPIDPASTLPGMLTRAGFQTRAQGKMHFRCERQHLGFEHMELLADYYREMKRYGRPLPMDTGLGQNELAPAISPQDERESLTRWVAARSADFLDTRDPTRPFFLHSSFSKPHPPLDPPANYWALYSDKQMPEPWQGDWSATADAVPAGFKQWTWEFNNIDRMSPSQINDARRAYYALITHIDYSLGHIFARLRENGLQDTTTIIFTTDHGEMLGDHKIGGKTVFFEGSAHIPFLILPAKGLVPDELRGTTCDTLCSLADILPTALGAVGVDAPTDRDGIDLLAVARGEVPARTCLQAEALTQHMVIDGDLKYIWTSAGGSELLFDLAADPHEERDLIRAGSHQAERDRLRGLLIARLAETGHPAQAKGELIAGPAPVEGRARGGWPGFHSLVEPNEVCH